MKSFRYFALAVFVCILLFLLTRGSLTLQQAPQSSELQTALTEVALASLKAEYDLLITAVTPTSGLIAQRRAETNSYDTAEERLARALRVRASALNSSRRYASVDVELKPSGVEHRTDRLILQATERTTENFTRDDSSRDIPNTTFGVTRHDFVFSISPASAIPEVSLYSIRLGDFVYTLIEDITEPQLLNFSDDSDPEEERYHSDSPGTPLDLYGNPGGGQVRTNTKNNKRSGIRKQ